MSDVANIVGKVTVDTAQAVRSVDQLKKSVDTAGGGFSGFASKAGDALGKVADGFGKFNLALGGIQKALGLAEDAFGLVKFSAEARFAEQRARELGVSAGEMASAVGGTVDDVTLLRFALKNLQGESALTKDQMLLVLKAADSLGDQGFGDTMKIADDLAKALKGGPTRALREYGIEVDDLKGTMGNSVVLMEKMRDVAAQVVSNDDIERLERYQAAWQNVINELKKLAQYIPDVIAVTGNIGLDGGTPSAIGNAARVLAEEQARRAAQAQKDAAELLRTGQFTGFFDTLNAGIEAWGGTSLSGLPGASWFEQKKKKIDDGRRDRGWRGDLTFDNLSRDFGAIGKGFGDWKKYGNEWNARESSFELDRGQRLFENQMSGGFDQGLSDNLAKINEIADDLREKGLADIFEQLNTVMMVGTPAVAAFADALMTGGNAFSALAKGLQQGLRALAIDSAVKALYALGEGFLFSNPKAFAAAAKYTAAAAAAGVGSAAIGALIGSGGGGGSSASVGSSSSGAGASITGSGGGGPVVINVQGNLYGQPAAFARAISDALDEGRRSGRVRDRAPRYH